MLWAEPITTNELSSLKYECLRWYDVCSHGLGTSRMIPVTINTPGCTGYSLYFRPWPDNDAILGLSGPHAHRVGQAFDFHRTAVYCPSNAIYTLVSMKDGERVHQVWYGCSLHPANVSHLAVSSSKQQPVHTTFYLQFDVAVGDNLWAVLDRHRIEPWWLPGEKKEYGREREIHLEASSYRFPE